MNQGPRHGKIGKVWSSESKVGQEQVVAQFMNQFTVEPIYWTIELTFLLSRLTSRQKQSQHELEIIETPTTIKHYARTKLGATSMW